MKDAPMHRAASFAGNHPVSCSSQFGGMPPLADMIEKAIRRTISDNLLKCIEVWKK